MTQQSLRIAFLTLPVEIRLRIYDYVLIARYNCTNPLMDGGKKIIRLSLEKWDEIRTMDPALLRSCKRIYSEASPILYSGNTFHITDPHEFVSFLTQIGPVHTKELKTLDICVPNGVCSPWVELFCKLARDATGLRSIAITWDPYFHLRPGSDNRKLGDDVQFVDALAKIRGLQRLHLQGLYSKRWPEYLEEKMGVPVQSSRGYEALGYFGQDRIITPQYNWQTLSEGD